MIEKTLLLPTYKEILEKYRKQDEVYGINILSDYTYESYKQLIKDSVDPDSFYRPSKEVRIFNRLLHKRPIEIIPIKEVSERLGQEIEKESKDSNTVNIDLILKSVDSQFKDLENWHSILGFDLSQNREVKNHIFKIFNENYSAKIRAKYYLSFGDGFSFEELRKSQDENKTISIKDTLSQEQIILVALERRFSNGAHSYRESLKNLENKIEELKNSYTSSLSLAIRYFLKTVDRSSIINFFNNLKKVLTKQLQQEELFLQNKDRSIGIIDEIKHGNVNIANEPISVDSLFVNIEDSNSPFSIFGSFIDQLFQKFNDIMNYFLFFPDEARGFFSLTDPGQIRNNLIKIINFMYNYNNNSVSGKDLNISSIKNIKELLSSLRLEFSIINGRIMTMEGAEKELKSQLTQAYDREDQPGAKEEEAEATKIEIVRIRKLLEGLSRASFSGIELINKLFQDKDLGSKKEKLEKAYSIARLLHNFSSNQGYIQLLVGSKYLEKAYNKSIFDVFTVLGSSLGSRYAQEPMEILNVIKKNKPDLIPPDYLSENIEYCIENLTKIKTSADLDLLIDKLISGDVSGNIKKFKYLLSLATEYENTVRWLSMAKPKVSEVFSPNFTAGSFRFRVLGDLDSYHFRVGIDTRCCQAIGNEGEAAAIDSFINPMAGVLLLEVKTDSGWNLAAQSYFHFAEIKEKNNVKKAILLDNIEAGNLSTKYEKNNFYKNAYAVLGVYLKNKGFDIVGCGKKFTEVIGVDDFEKASLPKDPRYFESETQKIGKFIITKKNKYTDFNEKSFYDLLKPKFIVNMPDNISSIETEMSTKSAAILEVCLKKVGNKRVNYLFKLSNVLKSYGMIKEARYVNGLLVKLV